MSLTMPFENNTLLGLEGQNCRSLAPLENASFPPPFQTLTAMDRLPKADRLQPPIFAKHAFLISTRERSAESIGRPQSKSNFCSLR